MTRSKYEDCTLWANDIQCHHCHQVVVVQGIPAQMLAQERVLHGRHYQCQSLTRLGSSTVAFISWKRIRLNLYLKAHVDHVCTVVVFVIWNAYISRNVDRFSPSHVMALLGPVADFGKLASHLPVGGEGEMRSGDLVSWCGSGVLNHWLFWTSPCASMPFVHVFGSSETCRNRMLHLSNWLS